MTFLPSLESRLSKFQKSPLLIPRIYFALLNLRAEKLPNFIGHSKSSQKNEIEKMLFKKNMQIWRA